MMYPVYAGVSKPQIREDTPLSTVAVILGQLLTEDTLDRFREEAQKSTLAQSVKDVISKEFYQGCNIPEAVRYMHNHHIKEVSQTGFVFGWILRHKALREERMSSGR